MNKYLSLTIAAVFFIPISAILKNVYQDVWYSQYLTLLFFLFLGIILFIWDFDKQLSIFLFVCLLSCFFISKLRPRAILMLWQIGLGCLGSYGISKFNQKQRRYIKKAILGIVSICFIWLILQFFNKDPVFKSLISPGKSEWVSLFGSKDQMGSFFALTSPVVFSFNPILSLISFIGLSAAKSSFALVSAVTAISLYACIMRKKMLSKIIFGIVVLSALFFLKIDRLHSGDFATRFNVWRYALKSTITGRIEIGADKNIRIIRTNPIFGYGLGNFLSLFPYVPPEGKNFNMENEKFTHAHNDPIEIFFELGYVGLLAMILLISSVIYSFIKVKIKGIELVQYFCCLIAFLLNSLGNFVSHIAPSGFLLILFFGLYKGALKDGQASATG